MRNVVTYASLYHHNTAQFLIFPLGASRCSGKFPKLEVNIGKYGDICRARNGKNYRCPKGCYKTRNGKVPFCQMSKNNKSPCREKSGETGTLILLDLFCNSEKSVNV